MSYARSAVTRMTLDMSRLDLQRSETVTQGDTNRRWEVTLTNGGAPFRLPPNWTAALTGIKPDGNGLQNGCSVVDGKIIYDFAAGKEIATCVGSYPVQFDIWDEVGGLVASPKVYVNVLADVRPHAELESEGQYTQIGELIGKTNENDSKIEEAIEKISEISIAMMERYTKSGSFTIPASEWSDLMPTMAYVGIQGGEALNNGGLLLITPADEATKEACERTGVRVDIDLVIDNQPPSPDQIVFIRADEAPTIPLNFKWYAFRAESEQSAEVVMIGVDRFGAGGGTDGVNQAEVEEVIKQLVPEWARANQKPTYTPEEVKARPATWTPTAADVGADSKGTAADEVKNHNEDGGSHVDIRLDVTTLRTMLNTVIGTDTGKSMRAVAALVVAEIVGNASDSFDTLEEIAAWIEAHPNDVAAMVKRITDLEAAMGGKVSKTDIINTLDSTALDKPLSAAMGKQLAAAISQVNETLAGKTNVQQVSDTITAALKDYLTTAKAAELYQPKGDYLTPTAAAPIINTEVNKVVTERKEELRGKPGKDGMTQLTPLYAESVEWLEQNGEQDKLYVLPDGFIYAYMSTKVEKGGYTNSINMDSSDFKAGYRFTISAGEPKTATTTDKASAFVSNAFACKKGDALFIKGVSTSAVTLNVAPIFLVCPVLSDGTIPTNHGFALEQPLDTSQTFSDWRQAWNAVERLDDGTIKWTYAVNNTGRNVASDNLSEETTLVRISGVATNGFENVIVSVGKEIVEPTVEYVYQWKNTGHAFVPADYEAEIIELDGRIGEIEDEMDAVKNDVADIKQNGVASKGASFDYTAYGLPILYLNGDTTGMDKDNKVTLDYIYGDRSGTCTVKWQGSSSLAYPKKNYTVTFDTAFEAAEGWGAQKKYCMKANFMEFSHSRNLCSAKLWGQIVKSRATPDARLAALPNGGAVDGFPIVLVINNEYMGLYTFNIPKDGWMFGMGDGTQEAILCADKWSASNQATLFRNEALCDGSDFEVEYVTDEDDSSWVAESLNRLINACLASDGSDIDTTIAQYVDIDSAIDYLIFTPLVHGADMVKKNYLIATYDGIKWFFSAYDMDSTFGITWDGGYYKEAAGAWKEAAGASGKYPVRESMMDHKLLQLLWHNKQDRVKARYAELRGGVMSEANVAHEFLEFASVINKAYFDEEPKVWPTIPATGANNANQIVTHYMLRTPKIDKDFM